MYKQMMGVEGSDTTASTPDHWAAAFARSRVMDEGRRRRFRRFHEWKLIRRQLRDGVAVLDAGCGFGEWVNVLSDAGYQATGVDFSEKLITRLREAYPSSRWVHSDIRHIDLPDASLDAVVSWGVIEHDEAGPSDALREFFRILRPGGLIIVSVPIDSRQQRLAGDVVFLGSASKVAFFQYAMTTSELAQACREAGFDPVDQGTLAGAAHMLMTPRLYLWIQEQGAIGKVIGRIVQPLAALFRRYHVMTYVVARRA